MITSGLRNSEFTPSIIPEAHSHPARAGTGSGLPARCPPPHRRNLRPTALARWVTARLTSGFGGPGAPPAPLGSSWEQRWAQTARACHEPQDHRPATGTGLADSEQGHGDSAKFGTSLCTEQRKGLGEHPRTRQRTALQEVPSRTAGSNEQVCQTLFNWDWDHQASCLTREFSESGHCWIF